MHLCRCRFMHVSNLHRSGRTCCSSSYKAATLLQTYVQYVYASLSSRYEMKTHTRSWVKGWSDNTNILAQGHAQSLTLSIRHTQGKREVPKKTFNLFRQSEKSRHVLVDLCRGR
jgi:hypothetical protein